MTDPIAEWLADALPQLRRALQATMRSPKALVSVLLMVVVVFVLALMPWNTRDSDRNIHLIASADT